MATSLKPDAAEKTSAATAKKTVPAKKPALSAEKPLAKPIVKASQVTASKAVGSAAVKSEEKPADKNAKPKKSKLVRDSFTMPEAEYNLIAAVKKRCIAKGMAVKKSEVLRAAIIGFAGQSDAAVAAALRALDVIKTGRPPKGQK